MKKCKESPQAVLNYQISDGKLLRYTRASHDLLSTHEWKLVVPKGDAIEIIRDHHAGENSTHEGAFKTFKYLSKYYYWPKMYCTIKEFVAKCDTCKAHKIVTTGPQGLMSHPRRTTAPAEILSLDIIGPLVKSSEGYIYILSVVDIFSKYVWIFPLRKLTSRAIQNCLEKTIFLPIAVPRAIILDNATYFRSKSFRAFLSSYGIEDVRFSPFYSPQCNVVERHNQTIGTTLSILVGQNQRSWSRYLPLVQASLNNNESFATGFTAHLLLHGFEHVPNASLYPSKTSLPSKSTDNVVDQQQYAERLSELSDIYNEVTDALLKSYHKSAMRYNLRRNELIFRPGDLCWRRNHVLSKASEFFCAKLAPRFIKNRVREKVSNVVYVLEDLNGKITGKYHIKDLMKA
jgi:hypothetical protein